MVIVDIAGQRFNRLVAVCYSHIKEYPRSGRNTTLKQPYWVFQCDCGSKVTLSVSSVKAGGSMSCGCWRREASRINNTTHGQACSSTGDASRLYRIWAQMKRRCSLPTVKSYHRYGGRGIRVCDEWTNSFVTFEQWALANGYKSNLTLDRRDNDGHYEPDNCRWVTMVVQANNRKTSKLVVYHGETMTVAELARLEDINQATLRYRLSHGWSVEDAVSVVNSKK